MRYDSNRSGKPKDECDIYGDPRARLRAIELRLDHELPPTERQRLIRKKCKLELMMAGRDPRWSAGVGLGGVPGELKNKINEKKVINTILQTIEES